MSNQNKIHPKQQKTIVESETIQIKGMHCRSCEILIEDELKKIPGIGEIKVNHSQGLATIKYQGHRPPFEIVVKAIQAAGYEIGSESKPLISTNPSDYKDVVFSAIALAILYLILKNTGLMNIGIGQAGNYSNLTVVLLVGLTAGLSTCMALVGGLVLGISTRHTEKHPQATPIQRFRPHLFFNLGRIVSFFVLGALIGVLGSAFQLSGVTLGVLTILVGFVMIIIGLQLTELFPNLNSGSFTLPKNISKLFGIKTRQSNEYSHKNSAVMGALTFFLPCGFTQAMQLYAISTGEFTTGALVMGIFALGTTPGLLGVGGLTSVIKGAFAKRFFKFAGLLVIILALLNISNGYHLTGWKIDLSDSRKTNRNDPNVKIEKGIQIIRMAQNTNGYSPNYFTIQSGIPSKWIIDSKDPSSCSGGIISSKLGIRKLLKGGENIIEFTPKEPGEAKFSCLMGMYRGAFTIVENENALKDFKLPSDGGKVDQPQPKDKLDNTTLNPVTQPDGTVKYESGGNKSLQVIKTTYTLKDDIVPREFEANVGAPVRFEVDVKGDGLGCMSTIMIPGLVDQPELLEKGKTLKFNFTPKRLGEYQITCAMGVPRGILRVN